MTHAQSGYFESHGGVKLYYEDTGSGPPIVFCHEFAGDLRSWEPQVRYFAHRFRVITYNARGYPPSDVPTDPAAYSMDLAVDDVAHLLRHLNIPSAHVVGPVGWGCHLGRDGPSAQDDRIGCRPTKARRLSWIREERHGRTCHIPHRRAVRLAPLRTVPADLPRRSHAAGHRPSRLVGVRSLS